MSYLAEVEDAIEARLRGMIPRIQKVVSLTEERDWKKATQITPAIAILFNREFDDFEFATAGRGRVALGQSSRYQARRLSFFIFSITKSLRPKTSRDELEQYSLIDEIREALMGWRPIKGSLPFQLGDVRLADVSCGRAVYISEFLTTVCTPEPKHED